MDRFLQMLFHFIHMRWCLQLMCMWGCHRNMHKYNFDSKGQAKIMPHKKSMIFNTNLVKDPCFWYQALHCRGCSSWVFFRMRFGNRMWGKAITSKWYNKSRTNVPVLSQTERNHRKMSFALITWPHSSCNFVYSSLFHMNIYCTTEICMAKIHIMLCDNVMLNKNICPRNSCIIIALNRVISNVL